MHLVNCHRNFGCHNDRFSGALTAVSALWAWPTRVRAMRPEVLGFASSGSAPENLTKNYGNGSNKKQVPEFPSGTCWCIRNR